MPNLEAHISAAAKNQSVIDGLVAKLDEGYTEYAPWVVTVAFYKALHLVEGILYMEGMSSKDKRPIHAKDHKERNNILKANKFKNLWKHYRPLFEVSMVARYLCDTNTNTEETDFDEFLKRYIPNRSIQSYFLNHHLFQLQKAFDAKRMIFH